MTEIIAALPQQLGDYLSVVKLFFVLALAVPWLMACPWVHKDTKKLRIPQELWSGIVLAAGVLGLVIWLVMPIYIVGLMVYVIMAGAALLTYVVFRNGRVNDDQKVLTAQHLSNLFSNRKAPDVKVETRVKLYGHDNKIIVAPDSGDDAEKETFNNVQNLLYEILYYRASEADLLPINGSAAYAW